MFSKKKAEYLAAKNEYNESLQEYTEEQEILKSKQKADKVVYKVNKSWPISDLNNLLLLSH